MIRTCATTIGDWACPQTDLFGDSRCILHSDDPEKSLRLFSLLVKKQVENFDFDFRRYVFPDGFKLSPDNYRGADFSGAIFLGGLALEGCHFDRGTYFKDAVFHGELKLGGASFLGHTSFLGSTFKQAVDARGTKFEGVTTFEGATFERNCRFDGITFSFDAIFSIAIFYGAASFLNTVFHGSARFRNCTTFHEANFSQATFDGMVDLSYFFQAADERVLRFENCTFNYQVQLNNIKRMVSASFNHSQFLDDVTLFSSHFSGRISLSWCEFHSTVLSDNCVVYGAIFLTASTFHRDVLVSHLSSPTEYLERATIYFSSSIFETRLNISDSVMGNLSLMECNISILFLYGASFYHTVALDRLKISDSFDTRDVEFRSYVKFRGLSLPKGYALEGIRFTGHGDFGGMDLDGITFRQMDLSNCRFADSINLAKAEFDNVTWSHWPERGESTSFALFETVRQSCVAKWDSWSERQRHRREWSRIAVADELDARAAGLETDDRRKKLRAAERVYRGLRASHEAHKDHPRASAFYFAEMEMRRLAGSLNPASPYRDMLTPLYALVSGYGENWRRAASWFLGLWLVCALVYLGTGLSLKVAGPSAQGVLQIVLIDVAGPGWLAACVQLACSPQPIGAALMHSFYVATFIGRDIHAVVPPGLGEVVQLFELLLGPVFLAFGALAVRRRFQR